MSNAYKEFIQYACLVIAFSIMNCCWATQPPVPAIAHTHLSQRNEYMLQLLAKGHLLNDGYVKPINLNHVAQQYFPFFPIVITNIVFEYLEWAPTLRYERLYRGNKVQTAILFDDYIGSRLGAVCTTINPEKFYDACEKEEKGFFATHSAIDILRRIVGDIAQLSTNYDYQASPYEFSLGYKPINNHHCKMCGERFSIIPGGRDSIYTLHKNQLDQIMQSADHGTMLMRAMALPQDLTATCKNCKSVTPVVVQETFVELPKFLLLNLDRDPGRGLNAPKTIKVPAQITTKYTLEGVLIKWILTNENGQSTAHNLQLRGPKNSWFLYDDNKIKKLDRPFNESGELQSYAIATSENIKAAFDMSNVKCWYPELMLYRREKPSIKERIIAHLKK